MKLFQKSLFITLLLFICLDIPHFSQERSDSKVDPDSGKSPYQIHLDKAGQHFDKKEYDKALVELQAAIPKTGDKSELAHLYYAIGYTYQLKNDSTKAIENYKKGRIKQND